jgi:hypothetical protein
MIANIIHIAKHTVNPKVLAASTRHPEPIAATRSSRRFWSPLMRTRVAGNLLTQLDLYQGGFVAQLQL